MHFDLNFNGCIFNNSEICKESVLSKENISMNKCVFNTIFISNTLFMALKLILYILYIYYIYYIYIIYILYIYIYMSVNNTVLGQIISLLKN